MATRFPWKVRYSVLAILVATFTISSIDKIAMSVAIPYVAADMQLSPAEMGWVMSAFFLAYSIFQVPGGILADKFGVRRVATIAMVWWSFFTALTGAATSLVQLIGARFIFGLGEGVYPACAFKTVATWFPKKERATANSFMFAATFLGAALAPLLVVAIITLWGWREVFFGLLIPGMVMAFIFWRFVSDDPSDNPRVGAAELREIAARDDDQRLPEVAGETLVAVLLNPIVLRYVATIFAFDLTYWGFTTWLPTYLVQARGLSMVEMGIFASLPAFAGTAGCILAGWMSDRYFSNRRRTPIILSQIIAAVFLYLTFTATTTTALVVFQTLAGFFLMYFFGVFWALPMNTVKPENMGVTGGFINMSGQIAAVTAPLVIGYLVDASGGFGSAFAFLIGALIISCLIVMTIPSAPSADARTAVI